MSNAALNWAFKASIPTGPKFVLVALADHAGVDGDTGRMETTAGQQTLAEETSMSVRSVARHLAWLEEQGLISREQRRRPDGYRTSDATILHTDSPATVSGDTVSPDRLSPDTDGDLTGQIRQISPDTVSGVKKNPQYEPSVEPGPLPAATAATPSKTPDPAPAAPKRGVRVPIPFAVTDEMRRWAFEHFPWLDVDAATVEFVDYWRAVPGAKGVKLDWAATWRNSVRKSAERVPDWRRKQLIAEHRPAPRPVPAIYDGDPDDLQAYQAWAAAHTAGVER